MTGGRFEEAASSHAQFLLAKRGVLAMRIDAGVIDTAHVTQITEAASEIRRVISIVVIQVIVV